MEQKKIGLMGGTFDPVHTGHLFIAREAAEIYGLDRVYLIPSAAPPHKKNHPSAEAEDRYRMTLLAAEDEPRFIVSACELERKGKSYTVDTVKVFRDKFKGAELYFIIGFDSYLEFDTWKDSEILLGECVFAAAPRTAEERASLRRGLRKGFKPLDIPILEISSTDIRNRVKKGRSIRYMVPPAVKKYIIQHNLYREEDE